MFGSTATVKKAEQTKKNSTNINLNNDYVKGLYLWGASGCGKTYLS